MSNRRQIGVEIIISISIQYQFDDSFSLDNIYFFLIKLL